MSGYWNAVSDQKQTFRASEQSQSSNKNQQGTHQSEESWKQTLASQERPKSPKLSDLGIEKLDSLGRHNPGASLGGKTGAGSAAIHKAAVRRWSGNPS